ncbi:hypothetical protein Tco_0413236 [Tanacetum coccineum]
MGRDTIQLEIAVSTISQEYLLEFTLEYGISEGLHPELPGRGDRIVDFLEVKVGVYTKFFEFANFRIPISQFLFDILCHYQIYLSQLSVIGAAKVNEKVFPTVMDACRGHVLCGGRGVVEHTPDPYPKTAGTPVMLSRTEQ